MLVAGGARVARFGPLLAPFGALAASARPGHKGPLGRARGRGGGGWAVQGQLGAGVFFLEAMVFF